MQPIRCYSLDSAASTAALEPGPPNDSGTIVSGNSVVFCNGRTGMTKGTPSGFFTGAFAGASLGFSSVMTQLLKNEKLSTRCSRLLRFFAQTQNQETVVIIAFDGGVFDRSGKSNHFFKTAVSNFQLIMRHSFT